MLYMNDIILWMEKKLKLTGNVELKITGKTVYMIC